MGAHILYYDEIANCVKRAYIEWSFIGHGNAENGLDKLKETLKDFYCTSELMQVSM